jgi:hypothetical protein
MGEHRDELLSAFDGAIAAARRLETDDLRTDDGASAAPLLARLRADLEARRGEIAEGATFDRGWAGRLIRWVAGWVPERELPLIARLGEIVRLGRED